MTAGERNVNINVIRKLLWAAMRRLMLAAEIDVMSPREPANARRLDKRANWEEMNYFRNIETVFPDF